MTTQLTPVARLAKAADFHGLHVKDAVRFADVLADADLEPNDVTQQLVNDATQYLRDRMSNLQRWIRKHNERIDPTVETKDELLTKNGRKRPVRKAGQKRVKLFGHSVTAVLRWMGANGWEFDDAAIAVETLTMSKVSDVTIRLQMKAGRDGKRGAPADITPSQAKQLRDAAE